MPVRTNILSAARQRARSARIENGKAIRAARMAAGLPMRSVAASIGRSDAWLSRMERGLVRGLTVDDLFVAAAAAGVRVWIGAYPGERVISDAPQLELLRRFRARIGERWSWQLEVVLPIAGDRRAADAVLRKGNLTIMVEAFTRLADVQAQLRAVHVKARDLGVTRCVVVLAATHANRRAAAAARHVLAEAFPMGTRATLRALAEGRDPGGDALVFV